MNPAGPSWVKGYINGCVGNDALVQCNFCVIFEVNLRQPKPGLSAAQLAENHFHDFSGQESIWTHLSKIHQAGLVDVFRISSHL